MICNGCGNQNATSIRISYKGTFKETEARELKETCDKCGGITAKGAPDVYFKDPCFEHNLGDDRHPDGQWVTSKAHKARIMREQNVREKGDRIRGARL